MLVENVMTPKEKVVTISPMASVREALKLMKEHKVRSVIVDKTKPDGAYGLLTFKNVLQNIIAEDGDIDLLNVYDIASTPAITVSSKLNAKYAATMMVQRSIKRILVVDNNELHGILTMTDIVEILMDSVG